MVSSSAYFGIFLSIISIVGGVASFLAGKWSDHHAHNRRLPLVVSGVGLVRANQSCVCVCVCGCGNVLFLFSFPSAFSLVFFLTCAPLLPNRDGPRCEDWQNYKGVDDRAKSWNPHSSSQPRRAGDPISFSPRRACLCTVFLSPPPLKLLCCFPLFLRHHIIIILCLNSLQISSEEAQFLAKHSTAQLDALEKVTDSVGTCMKEIRKKMDLERGFVYIYIYMFVHHLAIYSPWTHFYSLRK